jgi:hypothetical protein
LPEVNIRDIQDFAERIVDLATSKNVATRFPLPYAISSWAERTIRQANLETVRRGHNHFGSQPADLFFDFHLKPTLPGNSKHHQAGVMAVLIKIRLVSKETC